ncbi:hypothetical protein FQR65_LT13989 [Abscondita terminalis]|nr:hypothetical protein FQR65_LT13989 [Abscondita terminalis]
MSESVTNCNICSNQLQQELKLGANNDLVLNESPTVDVLNTIACNKCKVDEDATPRILQLRPYFVKEEIKTDELIDIAILECIPANILRCHQCNYTTNDKRNLTDHIFAHRFKCTHCNYSTLDDSMLVNHQQIHYHCGILHCDICNYTCLEMDLLVEHMLSHCAAEFSTNDDECHDRGCNANGKITLKLHKKSCANNEKVDVSNAICAIIKVSILKLLKYPQDKLKNTLVYTYGCDRIPSC